MFAKADTRPKTEPRRVEAREEKRNVPSIISADMTVTGDLRTEGDVQVDGVVQGDVRCGSLTVGEGGTVAGAITSESVRVHGSVVGAIRSRNVMLSATARVSGDIEHSELEIARGAVFEGASKRLAADANLDDAPAKPSEEGEVASTRGGRARDRAPALAAAPRRQPLVDDEDAAIEPVALEARAG